MSEEVTEVKDPQGLLKAYEKAKQDLIDLRNEKKELEKQLESVDDDAVNKWKERAVRAEAKANLESQGIKDADRILKYVSLEGVDFDDEGNLTGIDEKLSGIKEDFPELFDTKKRAGRNSADIHADGTAKTEMSPTERQVAQLFG